MPIALDSHPKFAVCLGAATCHRGDAEAAPAPAPEPVPRVEVPVATTPYASVRVPNRRRIVVYAALVTVLVAVGALAAVLVFRSPGPPSGSGVNEPAVIFCSHNGASNESWPNFAAWVEECWLGELDE